MCFFNLTAFFHIKNHLQLNTNLGVKGATQGSLLSLPARLQDVWIQPQVIHETDNDIDTAINHT